jgi:tRNA modification GTPase
VDLLTAASGTRSPIQDTLGISSDVSCVPVSALTGQGLQELEEAVVEAVFSGQVTASEVPLVTSPRHKGALQRALDHVDAAFTAHGAGYVADLVAIDLTAAVNALGEITGQTASDQILENIFSHFCVGK